MEGKALFIGLFDGGFYTIEEFLSPLFLTCRLLAAGRTVVRATGAGWYFIRLIGRIANGNGADISTTPSHNKGTGS